MRTLLAAATVLAGLAGLAAPAEADVHRRVVILRFDGPSALADEARELVMDAAGRDNDVVALGRWADAHKTASKKLRGAKAWAKSAREAQVDAIIEGAVRRGRRGYALELVVREAATGNEVDSVELQVDDDRRAERAIEGELTDLLAWVEPPSDRREVMRLDRSLDRDDRDDRDDDRRGRVSRRGRDDDRKDDREDDRRGRDDDRDARDGGDDGDADLDAGFGFADDERDDADADRDLADETVALLDGENPLASRRASAAPRKTMLRVAGGGYVTSRSLGVVASGGGAAASADGGHPTIGLHLRAEVFPFGEADAGRRLTGLGFRIDLAKALGNKVAAQVDGLATQLDVDQTAWSAAVAYRRPLDPVTVQLDLGYGSTSQSIVDKPMSVAVLDASYGYVRGGGRVELPIAARATVGAGAHYLYLTSAPEMQKLGAPSATGFEADASVEVPLTSSLTALGAVDYQRISLTFGAGGAASAATDSFLSARLALGLVY